MKTLRNLMTSVDEHSVEEFKPAVYLTLVTISLTAFINILAYALLISEVGTESGIQTYRDSVWTVLMSMTTIGFGDFYPVTNWGRTVVFSSFVVGAVHLGFIIQECAKIFGSDNSIKNRVLMTQLCEVMRKLEHVEEFMDMPVEVTSKSHLLDVVISQTPYESEELYHGYLTAGRDSSGMYILSLEALRRVDGSVYKRWIPAKNRDDLLHKFNRYHMDHNLF